LIYLGNNGGSNRQIERLASRQLEAEDLGIVRHLADALDSEGLERLGVQRALLRPSEKKKANSSQANIAKD
jgi:hypothetical protein